MIILGALSTMQFEEAVSERHELIMLLQTRSTDGVLYFRAPRAPTSLGQRAASPLCSMIRGFFYSRKYLLAHDKIMRVCHTKPPITCTCCLLG